jgi:RNA polymerase sigma-70 factor (sigma-E family)
MNEPGAEEEFEIFFRRHWPSAVERTRRLIGDVGEAEDVAAEAFARAFINWSRVGDLPHREAWIMRVASNVAIDRARSRRRSIARTARTAVRSNTSEGTDVVLNRASLVNALGALPTRQREVLLLRHLVGMSESEVAEALGVSVNSVKTHTSRAMSRLRSQVGGMTEDDLAF